MTESKDLSRIPHLKFNKHSRHSVEVLDNLPSLSSVNYSSLSTEKLHGLVNNFIELSSPRDSTGNGRHVSGDWRVIFHLLVLLSDIL